ncbi:hypothetical protein [Pseudomonas sp. S2_E01]
MNSKLLPNNMNCRSANWGSETTLLALPNSDSTQATANCEKKQRLVDEIDQLITRRDKYLRTAEEQYAEIAPLEALLATKN